MGKTVLFAWEMGGGLGHVARLRHVADGLSQHGYDALFVVRDVVGVRTFLGHDARVLQAPRWVPRRAWPNFQARTYADVLAIRGFDEPEDLFGMVAAWDDLFDLVRPDLIVADYAPTATLAAFGKLPVAHVGDGFTLPPAQLPTFPALRPTVEPVCPQDQILDTVRDVQRRRGLPSPDTLPQLFASKVRSICIFPELDPYAAWRQEPMAGPLDPPPPLTPLPEAPALYAYCAAGFSEIGALVGALGQLKEPVAAYVRDDPGPMRESLAARGVGVFDAPPNLVDVLPDATVMLSLGSLNVSQAAMAAGRAQVVLPRHLESAMTAKALEDLGVAVLVRGKISEGSLVDTLRKALRDEGLHARAQKLASEISGRDAPDPLRLTINGCLELLG